MNQTEANQPASDRLSPYTRVDLGTLGGRSSYAAGINNVGVVVGWSETALGAVHAFRWSPTHGMVDLGALPGDKASRAVAIIDGQTADAPEILGVSGDGTTWAPVVWSASGAIAVLPVPATGNVTTRYPTSFNSYGEVVGWDDGAGLQRGWVWSAIDGKVDLSANTQIPGGEGSASAITSAGRVLLTASTTACSRTLECWRTFIWSKSAGYLSLTTPTANQETNVTGFDLNEAGVIVGWTNAGSGAPAPYRWSAGSGFTLLSQYSNGANAYGYATAVNSFGITVGGDLDPASGSIVASIWSTAGEITKLSARDPNASVAIGINDFGTVVGWAAVADNTNHAVIWKAIPAASGSSTLSPATVTPRVSTNSTGCLMSASASRQSILDCVGKADRRR